MLSCRPDTIRLRPTCNIHSPDLSALSARINAERALFKTRLNDCFAPLYGLFTQHTATFIAGRLRPCC